MTAQDALPIDCVITINTMGQFENLVAGLDGSPRTIAEKELKTALIDCVCLHVSKDQSFYSALFESAQLRATKTFMQEVLAGGTFSRKISIEGRDEVLESIKGFDIGDPCGVP